MAQASIEAMQRMVEAFNDGDVERIVALAHPDFEASVPPELSTEPDVYRGADGLRRYFESFADAMEDIRFEPERVWEAEEATLVVQMRMTARGKQTGIPVEQRFAQKWVMSDGRTSVICTFPSLAQAFSAAGLPPGGG